MGSRVPGQRIRISIQANEYGVAAETLSLRFREETCCEQ
jgi:hypothetical protein